MTRNNGELIKKFISFQNALHRYFVNQGFSQAIVPPVIDTPAIEAHVIPLEISSKRYKLKDSSLHTSPEFRMKELLSYGIAPIYYLGYVFRDDPNSPTHRPQFTMLEWYRTHCDYYQIIKDTKDLIYELSRRNIHFLEITLQELFQEVLHVDLNQLLKLDEMRSYFLKAHPELVPSSEFEDWDDYFHLLFLNKIEPWLKNKEIVFVKKFPANLRALSKLDPSDPNYCLRFEVYANGVELGNCFQEETNQTQLLELINTERKKRLRHYNLNYKDPSVLLSALKRGLPESSGIAVGVERLFCFINKEESFFWD